MNHQHNYQTLTNDEKEDLSNDDGFSSSKKRYGVLLLGLVAVLLCCALVATTVLSILWAPTRDKAGQFAQLDGFCADVPPIQAAEYASRQAALVAELLSRGLAGAVFEAGSDLLYLTGVRWGLSERPFLFVLLRNGSSFYVAPAFEASRASAALPPSASPAPPLLVWQEDQSPYALATLPLAELCLSCANCTDCPALLGHDTRLFVASGLSAAWPPAPCPPLALSDDAEVVASLRRVKSPAEVALLRCATQATQAAIAAVAPLIREGMHEQQLKRLLFAAEQAAGLSDTWALVLFGPNAAFPHGTPAQAPLQRATGILIDTGGALHGYQSDVSRTLYPLAHAIPQQEMDAWQAVRQAQLAALERIASRLQGTDVTCAAVDQAARQVVADSGFGTDYQYFTHRLGHGIGLDGHEEPYLVRGNLLPLAPGNVFSVEPGLYNASHYGVRLEDIVLVTDEPPGYEVFGSLQTTPFHP